MYHPWLQGETYTYDQVRAEMSKRREQIASAQDDERQNR
jgi:hypothetical protein